MVKRLLAAAAVAAVAACQGVQTREAPRAEAQLQPTTGNQVSGSATFVQVGDRVRVRAIVSGLKPNQEHGFHVHEVGDCSSGDGMSAKGHFNPHAKPHGHGSAERHAGDLPNLRADANGRGEGRFEIDIITVSPGPGSVVGRGLIVHAQPDDYRSQPVGNAGARMACGVIRRS